MLRSDVAVIDDITQRFGKREDRSRGQMPLPKK